MSKTYQNIDEQLESIVHYIKDGIKKPSEFALGFELEHFIIARATGKSVPYFTNESFKVGIIDILNDISEYFSDLIYDSTNKNLLGLRRKNMEISLEPGGQLEVSIGPFKSPGEILSEYNLFYKQISPILDKYEYRLDTHGYRVVDCAKDIKLIPKERYFLMDQYLKQSGKYGINMMRCSASTQVSIDFDSEEDAINKLRLAYEKADYFAGKYQNSPIFEGKSSPFKMLRKTMWHNLDDSRTGVIPNLFDDGFSFENYALTVLTKPLMVVNYSDTPEYEAGEINGPVWQNAYNKSASELYPHRSLTKGEIEHIISTFFFDVRLKNFIELRMVDSLPIDKALEFVTEVKELFYTS